MQILWIRHGQTPGNVQRRYVGRTDEGLTDEAKSCLQKKKVLMQDLCVQTEGGRNPGKWYHAGAFVPDFVYSSPMMRCRETAEILFPGQVLCVQEGLQEKDFGDFEYKNYEELKEKGFITISGRVNRQYFYERLYGTGNPKGDTTMSYKAGQE